MPEYGLLTDEQLLAVEDEIWTPARTQQLIENVRYWKARHAALVGAARVLVEFGPPRYRMWCEACKGENDNHAPDCKWDMAAQAVCQEWAALVEGEDGDG